MTYHSLDEIYEEKSRVFGALERRVLSLSAPQLNFRRSEGDWTIAEIVEHLSIVESAQIRLFQVLAQRAESARGVRPAPVDVSIDDSFRDGANGKIKTREQSEPTGNVSVGDSLQNMRSVQDRLVALRPGLDGLDLSAARFQHPAIGDLTLGQWLVFFGVHEQRHLGQIKSVMSSPAFPRI